MLDSLLDKILARHANGHTPRGFFWIWHMIESELTVRGLYADIWPAEAVTLCGNRHRQLFQAECFDALIPRAQRAFALEQVPWFR